MSQIGDVARERGFEVENDKENCDEVKTNVKLAARVFECRKTAFIFRQFCFGWLVCAGQATDPHGQENEQARKAQCDH